MTEPKLNPAADEPAQHNADREAERRPLARFRSKRPANAGGVETLLEALPHYPVPDAKDFVRLHPNEDEYWSGDLCLVNVPIIGQRKDTLLLIDEDIARAHLPGGKIQRFRLALASSPGTSFFSRMSRRLFLTTPGTFRPCAGASKPGRVGRS